MERNGKTKHLGYYNTEIEASLVYLKAVDDYNNSNKNPDM